MHTHTHTPPGLFPQPTVAAALLFGCVGGLRALSLAFIIIVVSMDIMHIDDTRKGAGAGRICPTCRVILSARPSRTHATQTAVGFARLKLQFPPYTSVTGRDFCTKTQRLRSANGRCSRTP